MFILVIIAYSFLVIFEVKPLFKQKLWQDFWVNVVLGSFSFTIAILLCFDIKIPSPSNPIQEFITSIFGK
jgi:uncharacterized membrane protein